MCPQQTVKTRTRLLIERCLQICVILVALTAVVGLSVHHAQADEDRPKINAAGKLGKNPIRVGKGSTTMRKPVLKGKAVLKKSDLETPAVKNAPVKTAPVKTAPSRIDAARRAPAPQAAPPVKTSAEKGAETMAYAKKKKNKNKKKLKAKDAAFIKVMGTSSTDIKINGLEYPSTAKHGAAVRPGEVYEVVVTDIDTKASKTYKIKLKKGEQRIIVVSLSGGSATTHAPRTRQPTANVSQPKPDSPEDTPADGGGFLTVNSTPNAQVYVDGKLVSSQTPLVKHSVKAGNHTVRVYYVEQKKFSETKRAMITDGRHVNLYFQSRN